MGINYDEIAHLKASPTKPNYDEIAHLKAKPKGEVRNPLTKDEADWSTYRHGGKGPRGQTLTQGDAEVGAKGVASGLVGLTDIPQHLADLTRDYVVHPELSIPGVLDKITDRFSGKKHKPRTWEDSPVGKVRKSFNEYRGNEHHPIKESSSEEPLISSGIKRGIKGTTGVDITPHPVGAKQRIIANAGDFAGSLPAFSLGRLKNISQGAGKLAALKEGGKIAAQSGGYGAASQIFQEGGANPFIADMLSFAAPGGLKGLLNKIKTTATDIRPGKVKHKVHSDAKDLEIDLSAKSITEGNSANRLDYLLSKTPHIGAQLVESEAKRNKQFQKKLREGYDMVGLEDTKELDTQIKKLYETSQLEAEKQTVPTSELKNLKELLKEPLTHSPNPNDKEKVIIKMINGIKKSFGVRGKAAEGSGSGVKTLIDKISGEKVTFNPTDGFQFAPTTQKMASIPALIGQKVSLNGAVDFNTVEGIKAYVKKLSKAISEDVKAAGEGTVWGENLREADRLFSSRARRLEVEDKTGVKATDYATGNMSYRKLSEAIHHPDNKRLLTERISPEAAEHFRKLGNVSRSLIKPEAGLLKPAILGHVGYVTSLVGLSHLALTNPVGAITLFGGAKYAQQLIDNPKFIDKLVKTAKSLETNPKSVKSMNGVRALNKISTETTGKVLISIKDFQKEVKDKKGGRK